MAKRKGKYTLAEQRAMATRKRLKDRIKTVKKEQYVLQKEIEYLNAKHDLLNLEEKTTAKSTDEEKK